MLLYKCHAVYLMVTIAHLMYSYRYRCSREYNINTSYPDCYCCRDKLCYNNIIGDFDCCSVNNCFKEEELHFKAT